MRKLFTLNLILLFACALHGQIRIGSSLRDSAKFNNRFYKQELGIGIQGIFAGYIGSNLVWKVRDDRGKLIPVSYANYWRFQAGTTGSTFTGYHDSLATATNIQVNNIAPAQSSSHLWVSIGRERNNFFNRFNFFYGWDAGPSFSYQRRNSIVSTPILNAIGQTVGFQYVPIVSKEIDLGARLHALIGVKYHFTDRISLSFESALYLGYTYGRRKVSVDINGEKTTSKPASYHSISHGLDYLRFITLNYRFKQY